MLETICAHLHNYFIADKNGQPFHRETGTFTITDGAIDLPFLVEGSYFLVTGSRFNDGIFKYPGDDLNDETFTGTIWEMRPPRAFLALADEIAAWNDKYGATVNSPYQSENVIGVYSYQLKASGMSVGQNLATWQNIFSTRLNEWRKIA